MGGDLKRKRLGLKVKRKIGREGEIEEETGRDRER